MIARCNNPDCDSYSRYGGRGIKVCDEWLNINNFYTWAINHGYRSGLSIERKDVNGDYEPGNCTWIPLSEQAKNRTTSKIITYKNETMNLIDWARKLGIKYVTLKNRLRLGWNIERAFETNPDDYKMGRRMR